MKNTRQRVIDYIKTRNSASIFEISQVLNITPASARYHVQSLLKQDILEVIGIQTDRIPRRPPRVFSLTSFMRQHNLDGLASSLLNYMLHNKTPEEKQDTLIELTHYMCGKTTISTGTLTKKLVEAILTLNNMNYNAHWEAHATTPKIIFNHCPYVTILPEHPELCQLDQFLLHTLTGTSFIQKYRLEKDKHGLTYCLFLQAK